MLLKIKASIKNQLPKNTVKRHGCVLVVIVFHSQLCPTLCSPTDCSTPGFPVLHLLPEFVQTHFPQRSTPSSPLGVGTTSSGPGQPSKEELKVRPLEAELPWRQGREVWRNSRCPVHSPPWRNSQFHVWARKEHNDPGMSCNRWKQKAVKDYNRLWEGKHTGKT